MRTGKTSTGCVLLLLVGIAGMVMVYQAGKPVITAARDSSRASPVVAPELSPVDLAVAEDQRAAAEAFFGVAMGSGVAKKVEAQVVWVDPLAWAIMNRDEKTGFIQNSAASMVALGGAPTVTIKSYANDRTLGGHGALRGTYITP